MPHQLNQIQKKGRSASRQTWLTKALVQAAKIGQLTKDESQLLFDVGANLNALSEAD